MINKFQRSSQVEKLADANALIFATIDELNDGGENYGDLAQDLDAAISIVTEVSKFLKSRHRLAVGHK